ncbi:MAG: tetratricopeptide repeat protein [Spirochaetia bacterium]
MRTRQIQIFRFFISIILLLAGVTVVLSATDSEQTALNAGLRAYGAGENDEAILRLRSILVDDANSEFAPDAHYWIARAAMRAERLSEAESNLEKYLSAYPEHEYYEEAVYQKGRLLYLQGDYQESIRQFQLFNEEFPRSQYQANSLFWTGESLVELGRIDEAERLYRAVMTHYPSSFRAEAARNRLDVTAAMRREQRMAELLQWSHTELLRARNEFSAREQAYELALQRYRSLDDTSVESELRQQLDDLLEEVRLLEAQLGAGAQPSADETTRLRAIGIKERALEMKERYLEQLIQQFEEG